MKYKTILLGEVAEVLNGYAFKSKDSIENGVPIVKIKNIEPPNVTLNDVQYVGYDLFKEKENFKLKFDDILISMTGSGVNHMASAVGKVGRFKLNKEALLNQRVGKIKVLNSQIYDENFLFYVLSQVDTRYQLASSAGGSANQANISPKQIKDLIIPNPSIEIQRVVGNILYNLDLKIYENNILIQNLEELSQTLFKRWFIDFEFPNEEGLPYKSSGGSTVKSELGEIPELFQSGVLGHLILETIGGDWGKETAQGTYIREVVILRGADIPKVRIGQVGKVPTRFILEKNYVNKKLNVGDVVIEISGGSPTQSTGRATYINKEIIDRYKDVLLCTNFCRSLRPKSQNTGLFIYMYFNYLYKEDLFYSYENGTTGIKNLDINSFLQAHQIPVPPVELIQKFNVEISNYYKYIQELGNENMKLVVLRDTLLPKLLSGEIKIPDESVVDCYI